MHHWVKRGLIAAAPLLLGGCLWGPGKFQSELTLRKDNSFVLDYRGEIVIQLPPDADTKTAPWSDKAAQCYAGEDGTKSAPMRESDTMPDERPCTKAEIAHQRAEYEKQAADAAAAKRKDNEEMAKAFGLPGLDDASNRAFAAKLMKYAGWRSVAYRGKGVFDVDYHFEGRATQDFVFPALPDNDLIIPFIAIRRRGDGSVFVNAPALTGGMNMFGPMSKEMGGDMKGPASRAEGRFTVHTDGQIVTNNSEDGPAADPVGQQVHWDIAPSANKIPETLIRL